VRNLSTTVEPLAVVVVVVLLLPRLLRLLRLGSGEAIFSMPASFLCIGFLSALLALLWPMLLPVLLWCAAAAVFWRARVTLAARELDPTANLAAIASDSYTLALRESQLRSMSLPFSSQVTKMVPAGLPADCND
jgi:hypothetical protein